MSGEVNVRVGVSSCLLGERVRFDGNHKRDDFVTGGLAAWVELVPVCPEVETGMPIPRPTIQLRRHQPEGAVHLVDSKTTTIDHTEAMQAYAARRIEELQKLDLCGYVFKAKSPSCGLFRVPVYYKAQPKRDGRGIFAAALTTAMPELPVEEEGRLRDAELRENFVERVFAYGRLRSVFRPDWTIGELVDFHSREKLLLLAHKPESYKRLGPIVAKAKQQDRGELEVAYRALFLEGVAEPTSRGKHVNVMQHILGYFKDTLSSEDRAELLAVIGDYQKELVPLIVPITLLRFFVKRFKLDYLEMQTYLNPHPKELMLRNRA